jgi:hypothetical protein
VIRLRDVRETIAWVDRSGVAPEIEDLLRPTKRGRPRQLTVRALLVGIKLAVDTAKTACLTDIHRVLTEQLSPSARWELGVVNSTTGSVVTLTQVRRLLSAIQTKLDTSSSVNGLPADVREVRAATLQQLLDRMLAATMPTDTVHGGSYAVDGTGTWSWARGKRRTDVSADPDAAWGVKTHKSGKTEAYFGYELHALVRINPVTQPGDSTPCLAERIIVVPASSSPATPVLAALKRLNYEGRAVNDVVADRGYSYKLEWTPGLLSLGVNSVLDLHATQYGARGTHEGARIVAGTPHCPAMPGTFDHIARPERLAAGETLDTFVADIDRREQWAFRRVAGPDISGKERYECPARAGRLRCPLHPTTMAAPLVTPTVQTPPPADEAPTCCRQRTITVPGSVDTKSRQRYYWGSRQWISAFSRRSRVEGWFGNLKNDSTEALGRGAFRVMGICKTSLMLTIYAVSTNLRLLRGWARRTRTSDDLLPLLTTVGQAGPGKLDLASSANPCGDPPAL